MRKVSLFIAISMDGYIAQDNDDLSFLSLVDKEGEDYGYADFTADVDTIILGRKTYDYVLKAIGPTFYDNGKRDIYVITRSERASEGRVRFFNGAPKDLILQLRSTTGKKIFCDGGAEVIDNLLQNDLIDEMTISIIPILLGGGVRLFKDNRPEQLYEFINSHSYDTGLVKLFYRRKR